MKRRPSSRVACKISRSVCCTVAPAASSWPCMRVCCHGLTKRVSRQRVSHGERGGRIHSSRLRPSFLLTATAALSEMSESRAITPADVCALLDCIRQTEEAPKCRMTTRSRANAPSDSSQPSSDDVLALFQDSQQPNSSQSQAWLASSQSMLPAVAPPQQPQARAKMRCMDGVHLPFWTGSLCRRLTFPHSLSLTVMSCKLYVR